MGTIFKILALCHFLGHFGSVTSDTCGSNQLKYQVTVVADMEGLAELLETKTQSQGDDSPKFYYSKDTISCSKPDDNCSEQRCCAGKTPKCNVGTKKCDCFDSASKKFTGRPIIYLQNSGKCGDNEAGCTICIDREATKKAFGLDQGQGQRLEGNGSALALSTIGNQTGLMENVKFLGSVLTIGLNSVGGLVDGVLATIATEGIGGTVTNLAAEITLPGGICGGLLGGIRNGSTGPTLLKID